MHVYPQNSESALCDPIVLREGPMVRLVFKPTLVRNHQDASHPVSGDFVYQKKKRDDEWEDDVTARINDIDAGTGVKLGLSTSEIDAVLRHVMALYGFYKANGIPRTKKEVVVSSAAPALDGDASALISNIVETKGSEVLASILTWASSANKSQEIIKELSRLDVTNIQRINSLIGVSGLKQFLELWNAHQDTNDEDFWQRELVKHPFVLSQVFSAPVVFIHEKPYVGGKGIENTGGKYPDFLLKNAATGNAIIVEIKKPTTPLLGKVYRSPDVFPPSDEVGGAVVQIARYKDRILKSYYQLREESNASFRAVSPQCLIIAGHTKEVMSDKGKSDSFDLFRNNLRECHLITYDELATKVKCLVELLEGTTTDDPPF